MATEKPTRRALSRLLNDLETVHKKDVHEYSGGFLNEANLYKPPRALSGASWPSAKSPEIVRKQRPQVNNNYNMLERLKNFSVGTSQSVGKNEAKSKRSGTKGPVKMPRGSAVSSQGSYSKLDDGVLVESMGNAELMVKKDTDQSRAWADYDYQEEGMHRPFSQASFKEQNLINVKHKFLPSHLSTVTRKDQYKRMMGFENNVLQKKSTLEQNVMSGSKAVEHLEERLQQDLDSLQFTGYGPNFHRLQIYSNIFEDLIDDSPTFKYILGTIKKEYDDFISSLLDQQPSRHKLLYDQVEQLNERATTNPTQLQEQQHKLDQLYLKANEAITENERLRSELEEERILAENMPQQEAEPQGPVGFTEPELDLADKIEEAHAAILEKIDLIKELRRNLRQHFVPSTVVTHLEQCIKETEVESQRYQSQKEFFESNCSQMESDLREAIENADTTEKDAKRIWRRVLQRDGDGQSEDGEEEAKWNWYIS